MSEWVKAKRNSAQIAQINTPRLRHSRAGGFFLDRITGFTQIFYLATEEKEEHPRL
jgi:hypothetical protein